MFLETKTEFESATVNVAIGVRGIEVLTVCGSYSVNKYSKLFIPTLDTTTKFVIMTI